MSDDTHASLAEITKRFSSLLPTGVEVHDKLMGPIEPDLTSSNLSNLAQQYINESEAEKKIRIARYKEAIIKYDKAEKEFFKKLDSAVLSRREEVIQESNEVDEEQMKSLEGEINSLLDQ
jgi:hypothetical protein